MKNRDHLFKIGTNGNSSGRPRGSFNKTTMAVQALLDGEAESLTRVAVEKALKGNMAALRVCLDRILPVRKERPITVALPEVSTIEGIVEALGVVTSAVAEGEITPGDAATLAGVLETKPKGNVTEMIYPMIPVFWSLPSRRHRTPKIVKIFVETDR